MAKEKEVLFEGDRATLTFELNGDTIGGLSAAELQILIDVAVRSIGCSCGVDQELSEGAAGHFENKEGRRDLFAGATQKTLASFALSAPEVALVQARFAGFHMLRGIAVAIPRKTPAQRGRQKSEARWPGFSLPALYAINEVAADDCVVVFVREDSKIRVRTLRSFFPQAA